MERHVLTRPATTLPRLHLAFMGMERVVARLEDHDISGPSKTADIELNMVRGATAPGRFTSSSSPAVTALKRVPGNWSAGNVAQHVLPKCYAVVISAVRLHLS